MLLHETRNSRRTVTLNSMLRIHSESRGNVDNLTNEGLDGFKMALNYYRVMETIRLEYLVVSCKIGPWNKTDEEPMKLEHDKLEKTKGLNRKTMMTMSLTCRAIWQMALWEQLLHRPSSLLVITRLNHLCSL